MTDTFPTRPDNREQVQFSLPSVSLVIHSSRRRLSFSFPSTGDSPQRRQSISLCLSLSLYSPFHPCLLVCREPPFLSSLGETSAECSSGIGWCRRLQKRQRMLSGSKSTMMDITTSKMLASRASFPEGMVPINPTAELNAGLWTLFAGATAMLAARLWAKLDRSHGLWWDDYILLISWVSCISLLLSLLGPLCVFQMRVSLYFLSFQPQFRRSTDTHKTLHI